MGDESKTVRDPHLWEALVSFVGLIIVMAIGIVVFKVDPHIPMFIGVVISAVVALKIGHKWETIESMMITGISRAMQACLILMIVGIMVGVWITSGTIPAMIYYGLMILKPSIFLIACVLICSITSLATGTSWGTMGTMGLALIGIAQGLGMPIGPTAGAIISGAYFGDKLSPLSDTTNLAPAMAGTDVFTHVKYMIKSTIVAYIIALVFFGIYGYMHVHGTEMDTSQLTVLMDGIAKNFKITPVLLLPPVIVIMAIAFKMPAIPGITLGVIVGAIMAPFFQDQATFGTLMDAALSGYVMESGIQSLDDLLTNGGLMNMSSSVLMTIIAMMFGGIMEGTKQLEVVVNKLTARIKSGAGLVTATEVTCVVSNAVMPEQYISILVPGRMFAETYRKNGLHPKCLSNALESAGTVTSPLVPWNTCGLYIAATLGISATTWIPWSVFNYVMPIVTIVFAFMGITITKMTAEEQARADAGELV